MRIVICHYIKTFIHVAVNFSLAWVLVYFLKTKYPKLLTKRKRITFLIAGTGFLLVAGIGKLGWPIQTYNGDSLAEDINSWIFLILSHIGTFLLFIDLVYISSNKFEKSNFQKKIKQKYVLAGVWEPKPGKKVRINFLYEKKYHPFVWIEIGKDGSIYLGRPGKRRAKYLRVDTVKSKDGVFKILYNKGKKITDPELLKRAKVSFHASGVVNASVTEKGWHSFIKPLRELNRRERLCCLLFQHPSQYKPIIKLPRKYDILLSYPFDEKCPLVCDVHVAPIEYSLSPLVIKEVKQQIQVILHYKNLTGISDLAIQMIFYHLYEEGPWPPATYTVWRAEKHQELANV